MDKTIEYLRVLYYTLREMKGQNFSSEEYKWRLGTRILNDIDVKAYNFLAKKQEPIYLFGIVVEVDYYNPDNVQIFEDITNKIASYQRG